MWEEICRRPLSCHHIPDTLFHLYCVVLAKILFSYVLLLVGVGRKIYSKVIRKRLLHMSNLDFTLLSKSDRFSISLSLTVESSFQKAGPRTDILYFDLLN